MLSIVVWTGARTTSIYKQEFASFFYSDSFIHGAYTLNCAAQYSGLTKRDWHCQRLLKEGLDPLSSFSPDLSRQNVPKYQSLTKGEFVEKSSQAQSMVPGHESTKQGRNIVNETTKPLEKESMPSYIVFVRFFPQFSKSFPFECFAHLMDKSLIDAFTLFYDEQKRANPEYNVKSPIVLQRPHELAGLEQGFCSEPQHAPLEMAHDDELIGGISHVCPVGCFSSRQSADNVKVALRDKVADLVRSTERQTTWTREDSFLATANPHFFVKSEGELPDFKMLLARMNFDRLANPPERHQKWEQAAWRFFLPMLDNILDEAYEFERESAQMAVKNPACKGMSVEEANDIAIRLEKKFGNPFFAMSIRIQAEQIGCHYRTWQKTSFYKTALEQGKIKLPKPKAAKALSLTKKREEVIGDGTEDEILGKLIEQEDEQEYEQEYEQEDEQEDEREDEQEYRRLVAESERDNKNNPSPLDYWGYGRRIHSRTRV